MHIAVLMGGDSPEREVSLASGKAVVKCLREAGHEVTAVDLKTVAEVIDLPALRHVDLVFPALHGGAGEDGHLQALLDILDIPYALSGHGASALAMDKAATKRLMRGAGIPTPEWLQVNWDRSQGLSSGMFDGAEPSAGKSESSKNSAPGTRTGGGFSSLTIEHVLDRAAEDLGFPLVIKLNGAGSSVGVEIVKSPNQFAGAFHKVANQSTDSRVDILIERYIPGQELTAALLLGRRLPLLEIRPTDGFYDYANKYTRGASEYLVPAPVHSPLYEQMCADALCLYDLLGCSGMARVDFRLDGNDHYCLEINTIPGMTETSLVPKAAAAVGIGFASLIEDLCLAGLANRGRGRIPSTLAADGGDNGTSGSEPTRD